MNFPLLKIANALPFSFSPIKGVLFDFDFISCFANFHSKSGLNKVMFALFPSINVASFIPNIFLGFIAIFSIKLLNPS